jgi:drug/metabolite transporter (DMT)-like permease
MPPLQKPQLLMSGRVYLLLAVIIFAAANAVTRLLTDLGANHLIDGRNPISFCNVLFVGNLVALVALAGLYRRDLSPTVLRQVSWRAWSLMALIAVLSGALAPALFFTALKQTTVNNVVLLGRIEPPLTLALSVWFLGERVNLWIVLGAAVSFLGVILTIVLQPPQEAMIQMAGWQIGQGELMALGGAVIAAIATVVSKASLGQIPLGLFNIARNAIGTVVFFVAVLIFFEPSHFMDVFTPVLWQWMVIYSLVIVVGGQLAWFKGLKTSSASEVSLASAFNPLAGVLAAFLILGEVPTVAQYIGGAVILVGIVLNQWGIHQTVAPPTPAPQTMESGTGFHGV